MGWKPGQEAAFRCHRRQPAFQLPLGPEREHGRRRAFQELRPRAKLLKDGHIDTVIGLPANLFYSTGIPVCILVLKKCKKPDDVLFINAAEHIDKIIDTYQHRKEEARYARRVETAEIEKNAFNLNISRYVSMAIAEEEIDLTAVHAKLRHLESAIQAATAKHNEFLNELGLPLLPVGSAGATKA